MTRGGRSGRALREPVDPLTGRERRLRAAVASWRTAIRIAAREARRAPGRTTLVLAMITLPVLALSFAAVSYDMLTLTRAEQLDRRIGTADAELRWVTNRPIEQDLNGDWQDSSGEPARPATAAEVTALLPAGSRVIPISYWQVVEVRTANGIGNFNARALDLADPLTRGMARLRAGRAPGGADEVAASERALRRLGVSLGDTLRRADDTGDYRVVGVVEFPDDLGEVFALPPPTGAPDQEQTVWLADTPEPVDWATIRALNARGLVAASRAVILDPPAEAWRVARSTGGLDVDGLSIGGLVGGLGLLEVVLLAGPAFAVGARRRRRDLALVAANGGNAAHLRRIVLADGVVVGIAGAVLGVGLGIALAFAGRSLVEQFLAGSRAGGYRCFPFALLAIGTLAVLAGLLAALVPAYTAARQDVLAGLTGRRNTRRPRRRWLLAGLAATGAGVALAGYGATRFSTIAILAGVIIGELGLVLCTPTLVGLLARAGRVLPLAPRIALRDAGRNRSSAAPAISAIMAAVAGSVAIGIYIASDEARSEAQYQPALPPGYVLLNLDSTPAVPDPAAVDRIEAAAREHLAGTGLARVSVAECPDDRDPTTSCLVSARLPPALVCPYEWGAWLPDAQERAALADPRCDRPPPLYWGTGMPLVVDDGTALPLLTGATGADLARAVETLRAGGVVVTDPRYLTAGRVAVDVRADPDRAVASSSFPGYVLGTGIGTDRVVLSRPAAARLGLVERPIGFVVPTTAVPSVADEERFTAAVWALTPLHVSVERESSNTDDVELLVLAIAAGIITIGAAGTATGLAAADSRSDLSTLAAVGAAPRVRRLLSLSQAGVIAGTGSVLGIAAGVGSALVILTAFNRQLAVSWPVEVPFPLVVPWSILGILVVVPLVAMLGAGLLTRSRLPVERRLD